MIARIFIFLLCLTTAAMAQSVQQSGSVTPGHAAAWLTNGVIQDAGTAASGKFTSLGTTGQGPTICANSAPISQPYVALCLAANTNSAAILSLQNYGGASAQPLQFNINGTVYDFPYTIGGIVGPGSSTVGDAACWNNSSGSLLKDCGYAPLTNALSSGEIFVGSIGGVATAVAMSGDCTIVASGAITCSVDAGGATSIRNGVNGNCLYDNGGAVGSFPCAPMPQGRLTLASGTPVMAASQTSQTTIYYDCYRGNLMPYYTGSADAVATITNCQVSTALQASGTGVLNDNGVFDVWGVNNSGAVTICIATNGSGGGWASDTGGSNTARGTGYSQLDTTTRPYITNKNAIADCYNGSTNLGSIGANQATYLGTIATDVSNAGEVSYTFGTSGSGGGGARFGLWNAYNRVIVATGVVSDSASSWTYAVENTWREANGDTTFNVVMVRGLNEDGLAFTYNSINKASSGNAAYAGIGVDSTTTWTGTTGFNGISANPQSVIATYSGYPGVGLHTVSALEQNNSSSAATFYGTNSSVQSGLSGQVVQ